MYSVIMDALQLRSVVLLAKISAISLFSGGLVVFLNSWPELWPVIGLLGGYKCLHLILKEVQSLINENEKEVSV